MFKDETTIPCEYSDFGTGLWGRAFTAIPTIFDVFLRNHLEKNCIKIFLKNSKRFGHFYRHKKEKRKNKKTQTNKRRQKEHSWAKQQIVNTDIQIQEFPYFAKKLNKYAVQRKM